MAEDLPSEEDDYEVRVTYPKKLEHIGQNYGYDALTHELVGYTLTVSLVDTTTGASCWSLVKVEDKAPPEYVCVDTIISCFAFAEIFSESNILFIKSINIFVPL